MSREPGASPEDQDLRAGPERAGSYSLKQIVDVARCIGLPTCLERLVYPLRKRYYEARYRPEQAAPRSPAGTARALLRREGQPSLDRPLGRLLFHRRDGQLVDLVCENAVLRVEVLAAGIVRLRLLAEASDAPPFSYALDPGARWEPTELELVEGAGGLEMRSGELTCRVEPDPCRLAFYNAQGRPLAETAGGLGFRGEGAYYTHRLHEAEAVYGLGEKAFGLNLRGLHLEMWNCDPESYGPGRDPLYISIPMLVALRDGQAYGLFFDNPGAAHLDLGRARNDLLRYEADTGELCVYVMAGPGIADVVERYTALTGRMPLPPRWLLGYHQSRWSYYPESRVRELAAEFRQRRIPCDALHLDIHYMDGYRVFTWDAERFPDPAGLLADLRREGLRAVCIIDPGVKVDPGYAVHDEGLMRDAFCRLPDGSLFQGPVWPGQCYFPDFTNPEVRQWWGGLYRPLLEAGVSGFWNDMNEPAIFGGGMPGVVRHSYEGQGASHGRVHNVYGLQMARASAEGLAKLAPEERVPLISRSGYAGLQRYAMVWTGDNHSTWAHLRLGVSMCLNLGLSGLALCGPDVGGFAGDCGGELLARWMQVGALTPFFRNHSALGTAQQECWQFGEPHESIYRRWIEFRYRLLPYVYTAAWQAAQSGLPMMRPLVLAYPGDLRTYNLDDQFLLGDSLLAAPVTRPGRRERRVYLPGGPWYDFWEDRLLDGEVDVEAPLERMPLFVRAGSVLPLGPVMQHTGEWPPDALQLHVYPGNGQSWLYEDDGHSLDYRAGQFQATRFDIAQLPGGGLALSREVEGAFHPGYDRFEIRIHGLQAPPQRVLVDGKPADAAFDADSATASLSATSWSSVEVR
jgi:alpha-glucosidase